jgi:hypothetical protein
MQVTAPRLRAWLNGTYGRKAMAQNPKDMQDVPPSLPEEAAILVCIAAIDTANTDDLCLHQPARKLFILTRAAINQTSDIDIAATALTRYLLEYGETKCELFPGLSRSLIYDFAMWVNRANGMEHKKFWRNPPAELPRAQAAEASRVERKERPAKGSGHQA